MRRFGLGSCAHFPGQPGEMWHYADIARSVFIGPRHASPTALAISAQNRTGRLQNTGKWRPTQMAAAPCMSVEMKLQCFLIFGFKPCVTQPSHRKAPPETLSIMQSPRHCLYRLRPRAGRHRLADYSSAVRARTSLSCRRGKPIQFQHLESQNDRI
jgi:hypothetical protein